ncbi:unnamed protein product [Owenia fusiformis]|nr:unnamed protein product [Owenia fusiformis]
MVTLAHRLRRVAIVFASILGTAYIILVLIALLNYNPRVKIGMPIIVDDAELPGAGTRCKMDPDLGPVKVDIYTKPCMEELERMNPEIQAGGAWKPPNCQSWQKVAIVIPYRDRLGHLKILLRRLHPMLRKQQIAYRIFVVEQAGTDQFNRGRLMNIGYAEAMKEDNFDCFIFHDVDLIPEDDRNVYLCDDQARHLSSAIDEMRYHIMYYNYAGGVIALNRQNVLKVNGYSNDYWGWGNEDDDFSARTLAAGLMLTRPPEHIGRFKMVRHLKADRSNHGNSYFFTWRSRWKNDGINAIKELNYKVVEKTDLPVFTNISVDIGHPPDEKTWNERNKNQESVTML